MVTGVVQAQSAITPLVRVAEYRLSITDPSGLTIDRSGAFLWTVSDERGGGVYAISFDGEILTRLEYEGDDIEGITQDPSDGTLWIVEERLREVLQLDRTGAVLQRFPVDLPVVELNTGLEGIAFDPVERRLLVANQNLPRVIVELALDGTETARTVINFDPPFRIVDLSGLWYDPATQELWIVSAASARILVLDSTMQPARVYQLDRLKYEGIAVDRAHQRVFLVNDELNTISVFRLPDEP